MRANRSILLLVSCAIAGCTAGDYSRQSIIEGAQIIAEEPDFATSPGSRGSSVDKHYFCDGSFLVALSEYKSVDGALIAPEDFLWEVYERYGAFVQDHIDYDRILGHIVTSRAITSNPNARRYDFKFVSRDVTVTYDVSWFRGGPVDLENPESEVQIRYWIRIN